jgi:hypothetical protein
VEVMALIEQRRWKRSRERRKWWRRRRVRPS